MHAFILGVAAAHRDRRHGARASRARRPRPARSRKQPCSSASSVPSAGVLDRCGDSGGGSRCVAARLDRAQRARRRGAAVDRPHPTRRAARARRVLNTGQRTTRAPPCTARAARSDERGETDRGLRPGVQRLLRRAGRRPWPRASGQRAFGLRWSSRCLPAPTAAPVPQATRAHRGGAVPPTELGSGKAWRVLQAMRWPETAKPERLHARAWIERADGRLVAMAGERCAAMTDRIAAA